MKPLRPYQEQAISSLRAALVRGARRPVLQLPTGGGKTRIATEIILMARRKGNRVLFVIPALELIDQTVEAFVYEGVTDVGVVQANHPMTNPSASVQVCSVQTLARRGAPKADLVIVDECHRMYKFVAQWMADPEWARVPFVGLSATPWARGMANHYDDLIIASTTKDMIGEGWLSDFEVYAPSHPDLSGVKTVAGDYHEGQLSEAMQAGTLTADIVDTWLKHGHGRPTLAFCVDRAHAQLVQAHFLQAGVRCGYMDAMTPPEERAQIRRQFHDGDLEVVSNVGVLTTGVDWDVRCLILARPTNSEILFVQIIGRALRTAPGKDKAVILDHSDTHLRLGLVTDIHRTTLKNGETGSGRSQDRERSAPLPKECPKCTFLKPPAVAECPKCGFIPKRPSNVEIEDGELVRINGKAKGTNGKKVYTSEEKLRFYQGLIWIALDRKRKRGWAYHAYKKKFGVNPVWSNDRTQPVKPSGEVLAWARHCDMAYARGRKQNA